MKKYNIPAPKWIRIVRDSWAILGAAFVNYIDVFDIPHKSETILIGTVTFIGALVTIACVFMGQSPTPSRTVRKKLADDKN